MSAFYSADETLYSADETSLADTNRAAEYKRALFVSAFFSADEKKRPTQIGLFCRRDTFEH